MSEQEETEMEAQVLTTDDIAPDRSWGWKVSAYLWTKSISAGSFLLAAIALGLGKVKSHWVFEAAAPSLALIFLAATLALLVLDLERPGRFLQTLFTPQRRSWLVIGSYILVIYGACIALWFVSQSTGQYWMEGPVMLVGGLFAVLSAIYSAFLFRQAGGRVFWNSPFTPLFLLVQALVAGSAALMLVLAVESMISGNLLGDAAWQFLHYELMGALIANGALMAGEVFMPEDQPEKQRAVQLITRGYFSKWFWGGAVVMGHLIPLIALFFGADQTGIISIILSVFILAGLYLWEHIWVQAGQSVPLS